MTFWELEVYLIAMGLSLSMIKIEMSRSYIDSLIVSLELHADVTTTSLVLGNIGFDAIQIFLDLFLLVDHSVIGFHVATSFTDMGIHSLVF